MVLQDQRNKSMAEFPWSRGKFDCIDFREEDWMIIHLRLSKDYTKTRIKVRIFTLLITYIHVKISKGVWM